jgi:hypothetical protein
MSKLNRDQFSKWLGSRWLPAGGTVWVGVVGMTAALANIETGALRVENRNTPTRKMFLGSAAGTYPKLFFTGLYNTTGLTVPDYLFCVGPRTSLHFLCVSRRMLGTNFITPRGKHDCRYYPSIPVLRPCVTVLNIGLLTSFYGETSDQGASQ